jgi:hypothetical protein
MLDYLHLLVIYYKHKEVLVWHNQLSAFAWMQL